MLTFYGEAWHGLWQECYRVLLSSRICCMDGHSLSLQCIQQAKTKPSILGATQLEQIVCNVTAIFEELSKLEVCLYHRLRQHLFCADTSDA